MLPVSSFRDPDGCCFAWGKRILRIVHPRILAEIEPFLASPTAARFVGTENLPHIFFEHIKNFSRRELPTFPTRAEAMEWLVKD